LWVKFRVRALAAVPPFLAFPFFYPLSGSLIKCLAIILIYGNLILYFQGRAAVPIETHNVISDNMGVLRVKLKPTKMP